MSGTSTIGHCSRLVEAIPLHPQSANLQSITIIHIIHKQWRLIADDIAAWIVSFEEILLWGVVELHHGAEIGCLPFLIRWSNCVLICSLHAAETGRGVIQISVNAWPLITDFLIA